MQKFSFKKSFDGTCRIITYHNGMCWVQLKTADALDFEDFYMENNIGAGFYDDALRKKTKRFYSLRNALGMPFVTIIVTNENILLKCWGYKYGRPIYPYIKYIQDFINKIGARIADSETKNTGFIYQDGKYYDMFNLPKNFVVKGDLDLGGMSLTELPDLSTITVFGDFTCRANKLHSLKNSPYKVKKSYDCDFNELVSLDGITQDVGMNITCYHNNLITLRGIQSKIYGYLNCACNNIKSLYDGPVYVRERFDIEHNKLENLNYMPLFIGGKFYYGDNPCYVKQIQPNNSFVKFWLLKMKQHKK